MIKILSHALIILCITSAANAHIMPDANGILSDSGIIGPRYESIRDQLISLQKQHPEQTDLANIGTTVRGRNILGILIYDKTRQSGIERLSIITGSTHGNEYLNIEDRLAEGFFNGKGKNVSLDNYLKVGGALLVVPILNPDGYEARNRNNAHGIDLNRDFPNPLIPFEGLTQPETKQFENWVSSFLISTQSKLDIVVDYHCCNGSLLYPFSYTDQPIPEKDLKQHIFIAGLMQHHFPDYEHGSTGDVLGYYPVGTTKDYWYIKYGALAFTFEGKFEIENTHLNLHLMWWDDIFAYLSLPHFMQ